MWKKSANKKIVSVEKVCIVKFLCVGVCVCGKTVQLKIVTGQLKISNIFHRRFIVLSTFHRKTEKKYKFTTFGRISSVQLTLHCVNMPLKQGRTCPVCLKENRYYLGDHLRQVHKLLDAACQSKRRHLLSPQLARNTT